MYKTIVAHFAGAARDRSALPPAVDLARRFGAHLVGLAVVPPIVFQPAWVPGGRSTVVDEHRKVFIEDAKAARAAFEAAARDAGISAEWRDDDAGLSPVWRRVADYANTADITIAAAPPADPLITDSDEQVVLHVGRPLLFVPRAGDHVGFGKRVLVAWNGSREAARAAFDALPLLKRAETVQVVWIDPEQTGDGAPDIPAADLCTSLARHKVSCVAAQAASADGDAGKALLAAADSFQADLIVMGCYGHSRLREIVLGGATRHVLQHATVPVLMSH